jgi:hypothetical protein
MMLLPILFVGWLAQAEPQSHPAGVTCPELQRRWTERYERELNIVLLDDETIACGSRGEFLKPRAQAVLLAQAIHAVEAPKASSMPLGESFYDFVRHRAKSVIVADKDESLCASDAVAVALTAYVARNGYPAGTLLICPAYFGRDVTSEHRAATLVHEARHFDPDDPGHVPCDHGPYADGDQGCDAYHAADLTEGSGYHYALIYSRWLLDESDQTDFDKARLRSLISWTLRNRFNVEAGSGDSGRPSSHDRPSSK